MILTSGVLKNLKPISSQKQTIIDRGPLSSSFDPTSKSTSLHSPRQNDKDIVHILFQHVGSDNCSFTHLGTMTTTLPLTMAGAKRETKESRGDSSGHVIPERNNQINVYGHDRNRMGNNNELVII